MTGFACTDYPELMASIRPAAPPEPIEKPPYGVPLCCICNETDGKPPYWNVTIQTEDGQQIGLRLHNRLPLGRWMVRVRVGEEHPGELRFWGDADTPQQLRVQLAGRVVWAPVVNAEAALTWDDHDGIEGDD